MDDQTAADLLFGGSMKSSGVVAAEQAAKPAPGSIEDQAAKIYSGPQKYASPFDKPNAEAEAAKPQQETKAEPVEDDPAASGPEAVHALSEAMETEMGLDRADPINAELASLAAGELGLGKEGVQKLVALDLKNRETFWANTSKEWHQASMAEFSEAELSSAAAVVRTYGSPGLQKLLAEYGLGNHPDIVRFARNVARVTSLPRPQVRR